MSQSIVIKSDISLPTRYHWALLVGPKTEVDNGQGMRYHAKEKATGPGQSTWFFEARPIPLEATNMLLVRVLIGKIERKDLLRSVLEGVPIKQGVPGWNCVIWVQEALEALDANSKVLGTSVVDWQTVRDTTMEYVERKKAEHRFDGLGNFDTKKAPTYDMLENKETIP